VKTLIAVLLMVPSLMVAQQRSLTFASIPWGAGAAAVKQGMSQQGLTFTKIDEDGDLNFKGTLVGYSATAIALLNPAGQLVKTIVLIYVDDAKARQEYRDMKDVLSTKYGAPSNCFEYFKSPYEEGDGYEEQAIKLSKAVFTCFWGDPSHATGDGSISLEITTKLNLRLEYEGPNWHADLERRKAKETKAF
jgi:hypothetical protein